jgi:hypothetical protein
MITFFIIALVLIVVVFGVSSALQSYASAQQAQATIETAKAAQMATFGNVFVIVVSALLLLAVLGLIVYLVLQRQTSLRKIERPVSHAKMWKSAPAVRALPSSRNDIQERFMVEHLTPDELQQLADDLLDMIED